VVAEDAFFRRALDALVPYEPGKPVEEVQRELGLERVVKLASNEGPYGPFPAALEAIDRAARDLNRYPDSGAYRLRVAVAEKHGVPLENVALGSGADGVLMCLNLAVLEAGDEVVCGWPSFPSYVLNAIKLGAEAKCIPLADHRYDPDAILAAVTPRTKIVYLCNPNNPTGTMVTRAEVDTYFEHVPEHVLTVLDEAYFEYVEEPGYPDGIDYFKNGRRVLVLRTFSKIFGLAGLRVGYGIGSEDVVRTIGKVRNAFDINHIAQEAALASLGDAAELARRRRANAEGRAAVERVFADYGLVCAGPAVANFIYVEVGGDSREFSDRLLREGVIVRPLAPFGAAGAIRVTVGLPDENDFLASALERVCPLVARTGD
jgi:histidinol-phosphate aminotransferase